MTDTSTSHYDEFLKRFKSLSDEELKKTYYDDKKKPGWVRARGEFLSALRQEFKNRGIELQIEM